MKAFVFSIGERTTNLCIEQMEEMGFEVVLFQDRTTSLWEKLKKFYQSFLESGYETAVRIDADIIPNKNVLKLIAIKDQCLWHSAVGWDWYSQNRQSISIHHLKREAAEICLDNIELAKNKPRPETFLWRLQEFHHPRVCHNVDLSCGLHGYGQKNQRERIKNLKHLRGQDYDWQLVDKIEAL